MPRALPVLAATLALAACGPPSEDFPQAFQDAWCEAYQTECTTDLTFDSCRASGQPRDVEPPAPAGCRYDRAAAGACLRVSAWTCELDEVGGRRILVPPEACADVWTCD